MWGRQKAGLRREAGQRFYDCNERAQATLENSAGNQCKLQWQEKGKRVESSLGTDGVVERAVDRGVVRGRQCGRAILI